VACLTGGHGASEIEYSGPGGPGFVARAREYAGEHIVAARDSRSPSYSGMRASCSISCARGACGLRSQVLSGAWDVCVCEEGERWSVDVCVCVRRVHWCIFVSV
jgi:hypothetical protein